MDQDLYLLNVSDYKKSLNNISINRSNNFLKPNLYNLSLLTKDLYSLADGKHIWQNIKNVKRKINSYDFIFVNGIHSLSIKRLRERLDLKIFIEIDKEIYHFLYSNNQLNDIQFKSELEIKNFMIIKICKIIILIFH